jgi:hypothetical protein
MKNKKRSAAKAQRPNERAAREREGRRWQAREAARYIRDGMEALIRAAASEDSDESHKAMEVAKRCWLIAGLAITLGTTQLNGVAEKLRMVADALEGKLHGAKFDDAIREAVNKALHTGNRMDEREPDPDRVHRGDLPLAFVSEVHDKMVVVCTKRGFKETPTKDALRRRLKILGYGLSERPGARRKTNSKAKLPRPEITRNRGNHICQSPRNSRVAMQEHETT